MLRKLFAKKPLPRVSLRGEPACEFTVAKGQTVLEAALGEGIAWPHDCTVGTCGTCRARLIAGKVDAITPFGYTLSREELEAGYILACQAVPESDLEIAVDLEGVAARRTRGRIVATRNLTHDIKEVTWELDQPVDYRAGQYMAVTWPGAPGPRSYSFSTAPAQGGRTRVSAFIRKVPGGAFTERLFGEDLAHIPFEVEAPHGTFWLRDGEGPILLVGGGSGLSPLMSLLEDAVGRGVARDAVLLFGGREQRDLYCLDEIAAIARRWNGRFEFVPVLSEEASPDYRHGLVTAQIATAAAALGGPADLQAYMCGPPAMIDAGVTELLAVGVSLGDVHYDKFTGADAKTL